MKLNLDELDAGIADCAAQKMQTKPTLARSKEDKEGASITLRAAPCTLVDVSFTDVLHPFYTQATTVHSAPRTSSLLSMGCNYHRLGGSVRRWGGTGL